MLVNLTFYGMQQNPRTDGTYHICPMHTIHDPKLGTLVPFIEHKVPAVRNPDNLRVEGESPAVQAAASHVHTLAAVHYNRNRKVTLPHIPRNDKKLQKKITSRALGPLFRHAL